MLGIVLALDKTRCRAGRSWIYYWQKTGFGYRFRPLTNSWYTIRFCWYVKS